jgi:threonine synthase
VQELADKEGVYLANSMNSLRLEGQKTVAIELCQQLGWRVPDWVVIPGGNLGNVSALGAGFEMLLALGLIDRRPRICVAQAAHAQRLRARLERVVGRAGPRAADAPVPDVAARGERERRLVRARDLHHRLQS